ncbi:hypothetical protein CASFOL_040374 [Castilleja foliolosa]|uniref:CCDC93 coiled-coil domain-containing protein n=1 Tax=Castilleja foliolosa TaxID=1961234 RepID=A0ABD3BFA4_9LAMI
MDQLQTLCQRIDNECPNSLLQSLKALERQEIELRSKRSSNCSRLQREIDELDNMLHDGRNKKDSDKLHHSLEESNLRLESAKLELGEKLRSILSLKREFDDVASPAELIQYELRFTELNTQIQKKLQQTRKHYDTYNALLDIKELMLKEISLLNSISLQFQSAITSADGRIKLINSLEGILNGTQQKLDKVELGLKSEQKLYDSIKEKYVAVISEQRQSSSLLKLLQEECARNDRLQTQLHQHGS